MAIDFGKRFGFGTLRLPITDPADQGSINYSELCKMIDKFQAHGFTYYDTSYIYHDFKSEIALRECLVKRYPRDAYLLSTKVPVKFMSKKEDVERVFNEQLEKLGVDHFDFYLIHSINHESYEKCKKWGVFEFLKKKREEGKFREFGVSLHDTPEFLDQILTEHPEINFVTLQINYLDWYSPAIRSRELYETALKHGKPCISMEACKGGTLSEIPEEAVKLMKAYNPDASPASWAYRFCASLPNCRVVLSGMPKMEFLDDNIKTMENFVPLNDEEQEILKKVVDIINANTAIPCTTCRYCEPQCPKKIAIPDFFNLYNDYMRVNKNTKVTNVSTQSIFYQNIVNRGRGAASDCVKCGKCEKVCPQGLPIRDNLELVAKELEAFNALKNLTNTDENSDSASGLSTDYWKKKG